MVSPENTPLKAAAKQFGLKPRELLGLVHAGIIGGEETEAGVTIDLSHVRAYAAGRDAVLAQLRAELISIDQALAEKPWLTRDSLFEYKANKLLASKERGGRVLIVRSSLESLAARLPDWSPKPRRRSK